MDDPKTVETLMRRRRRLQGTMAESEIQTNAGKEAEIGIAPLRSTRLSSDTVPTLQLPGQAPAKGAVCPPRADCQHTAP